MVFQFVNDHYLVEFIVFFSWLKEIDVYYFRSSRLEVLCKKSDLENFS